MSDISEQQMDEMIQSLNKASGSLRKIADNYDSSSSGKAKASNKLSDDLQRKTLSDQAKDKIAKNKIANKQMSEYAESLRYATSSSDKFMSSVKDMTKGFAGGWIVSELIHYGSETVKTYQDLSNSGQSFGGSMLKMSKSAAAAGLPLETFAKLIKQNNVVVGQMGVDNFMKLNKQVRTLTERSGMYGYSVEELGQVTASYIDVQRLAGKNTAALTGPGTSNAIKNFALNVTSISDVLGANRDEVLKNTMAALSDSSVIAQQRINTAKGMDEYNKQLMGAVADLSAQAGEAGKVLGKTLADAFGSPGGANFTDLGKELNEVGQSAATSLIDSANRRLAAGEDHTTVMMDTVTKLHAQLADPQTLQSLQMLKMAGGEQGAAAAKVLEMAENLKTYTLEDINKAKADRVRTDAMTAFFASFESVFGKLKGALIDGFLGPLTAMKSLDPEAVNRFWDGLNNLEPVMKDFGERFGKLIVAFLTPTNIKLMGDGVIAMGELAVGSIKFAALLATGLTPVIKMVMGIFETLYKSLAKFNPQIAAVVTAFAALATFFLGKGLLKLITTRVMSMLSGGKIVTVRGKLVNVYGGNGGGGGGGGNPLDDLESGGKGKKGSRERNLRAKRLSEQRAKGLRGKAGAGAARTAVKELEEAEAAAKVAKGATTVGKLGGIGGKLMTGLGGLGRIGGRLGGALIPGIGAGLDAMGALHSAKEGNYLASGLYGLGAGVNGVGAALDATGVGAVAGVPLDILGGVLSAGGMAADATGFGKGWFQKKKNPVPATPNPPAPNGASPTDPATAASPTNPSGAAAQPTQIDEDKVEQIRTDALLGKDGAMEELKKLNEALAKHTVVIANLQAQNTQAVRQGTAVAQQALGF